MNSCIWKILWTVVGMSLNFNLWNYLFDTMAFLNCLFFVRGIFTWLLGFLNGHSDPKKIGLIIFLTWGIFLGWLPKTRLSTLPKHSLQAWQMVVDGLDAEGVSFILWFIGGSLIWLLLLFFFSFFLFCGYVFSFHFGLFVMFRWAWILGWDARVMSNMHGLWSWMSVKSYLNVVMVDTGILEIGGFHMFTMYILLKWSLSILVPRFGWPAF